MNYQELNWSGKFGNRYTNRNPHTAKQMDRLCIKRYGTSQSYIFANAYQGTGFVFGDYQKVLEVGCNVGSQLQIFQGLGLKNLYGIDINQNAVEKSKKLSKGINIIQGSAFDLPFKDNYFDLVFTSGLLIHINPFVDLAPVMQEIYRVSKQFILGFESYSDGWDTICYRGDKNLYWKGDYARYYNSLFHAPNGIKIINQKIYGYLDDSDNIDSCFLLEKIK